MAKKGKKPKSRITKRSSRRSKAKRRGRSKNIPYRAGAKAVAQSGDNVRVVVEKVVTGREGGYDTSKQAKAKRAREKRNQEAYQREVARGQRDRLDPFLDQANQQLGQRNQLRGWGSSLSSAFGGQQFTTGSPQLEKTLADEKDRQELKKLRDEETKRRLRKARGEEEEGKSGKQPPIRVVKKGVLGEALEGSAIIEAGQDREAIADLLVQNQEELEAIKTDLLKTMGGKGLSEYELTRLARGQLVENFLRRTGYTRKATSNFGVPIQTQTEKQNLRGYLPQEPTPKSTEERADKLAELNRRVQSRNPKPKVPPPVSRRIRSANLRDILLEERYGPAPSGASETQVGFQDDDKFKTSKQKERERRREAVNKVKLTQSGDIDLSVDTTPQIASRYKNKREKQGLGYRLITTSGGAVRRQIQEGIKKEEDTLEEGKKFIKRKETKAKESGIDGLMKELFRGAESRMRNRDPPSLKISEVSTDPSDFEDEAEVEADYQKRRQARREALFGERKDVEKQLADVRAKRRQARREALFGERKEVEEKLSEVRERRQQIKDEKPSGVESFTADPDADPSFKTLTPDEEPQDIGIPLEPPRPVLRLPQPETPPIPPPLIESDRDSGEVNRYGIPILRAVRPRQTREGPEPLPNVGDFQAGVLTDTATGVRTRIGDAPIRTAPTPPPLSQGRPVLRLPQTETPPKPPPLSEGIQESTREGGFNPEKRYSHNPDKRSITGFFTEEKRDQARQEINELNDKLKKLNQQFGMNITSTELMTKKNHPEIIKRFRQQVGESLEAMGEGFGKNEVQKYVDEELLPILRLANKVLKSRRRTPKTDRRRKKK